MICLGCFREVPDLVGPNADLCPECNGLAAEDFVPSLAAAWPDKVVKADGDFFRALVEDFAEFLSELGDFEDLEGFPDGVYFDSPADFPTFQGRPRFSP